MEFTSDLLAFQGVLISADNVQSFAKLDVKGGNEEKVRYVIEKITSFFTERGYMNNNGLVQDSINIVRTFGLYIILNADFTVLEEMVEMEGIDLFVWTIPTVPKYLVCEIFWNLHMDIFVYEVIAYTCPELALEIASAFIENFKYLDPIECLDKLKTLIMACYTLIYRLYLFEYNQDDLRNKLTSSLNCFLKGLKYLINPPNSYKLAALNSDAKYKFHGKCLQTMLQLIRDCFGEYKIEKIRDKSPSQSIYLMTLKEGSVKANPVSGITEDPILECLKNSHTALLDTCQSLIVEVSVDMFCAWSEFEEGDLNMQHSIGDACYELHTQLLNISSVADHPVVAMLEPISRKPKDIAQEINECNNETIIQNIISDPDKKWLHALINKEHLCNSRDLLEVIDRNLESFNGEECHKLFNLFQDSIEKKSENEDYLKLLVIKTFQKFNDNVKIEIIDKHFENVLFNNSKMTKEFFDMMTEVFNKLIATHDAKVTDILGLFIQNPQEVYIKIFDTGVENAQQAEIMMKAVKLLEKYSQHCYNEDVNPTVIKIAQLTFKRNLDTECKQNNLIKFMRDLKTHDILPKTKLFLMVVMPLMHDALVNRNIGNLIMHIKFLEAAFSLQELLTFRAPLLVMMGQILDIVRWKINTFVAIAADTVHQTIKIQNMLINSYNGEVPAHDTNWMRSKLQNLEPLNKYYYRTLWGSSGEHFFKFVSGLTIESNMRIETVTASLTQLLCKCTRQEWLYIWDDLEPALQRDQVLTAYSDAMAAVAAAERPHRSDASWACLLHSYANLVYVIRYRFFKEPLTDNQVMSAYRTIAAVTSLITEEEIEEVYVFLLPLFVYMAGKKSEYSVDLPLYIKTQPENKVIFNLVHKVFCNGTEESNISQSVHDV